MTREQGAFGPHTRAAPLAGSAYLKLCNPLVRQSLPPSQARLQETRLCPPIPTPAPPQLPPCPPPARQLQAREAGAPPS